MELLKKEGLSIIIERNFYKADSLNINLAANKYFYFRKVNDTPLYINALSPHLPAIIKQLPQIISKRNSDYLVMRKSSTKLNLSIKHLLKDSGNFHQCLLRGHPYSTYAQRVRGGFNPNAYNWVQGGREVLRMHAYAKIFFWTAKSQNFSFFVPKKLLIAIFYCVKKSVNRP